MTPPRSDPGPDRSGLRALPWIALAAFFSFVLGFGFNADWPCRFAMFDLQRLAQLGLLAAVALPLLVSRRQRARWLAAWRSIPPPAARGLLLLMAIGLISAAAAPAPRAALLEVALFVLLALAAFSWMAGTAAEAGAFYFVLLAGVVVYTLAYALAGWRVFRGWAPAPAAETAFPGFAHVRFFSDFQIWTLPLVTLPLFSRPRPGAWAGAGLVALGVAWWGIAWATGSRALYLGLLAGGVIVGVAGGRRVRGWLTSQGLFALSGIGLALLLGALVGKNAGPSPLRLTASDRPELWSRAWALIQAHPLQGAGPMHYAWSPNAVGAHPHSALLQFAAEWGLPAAAILAGLWLWATAGWLRRLRRAPPGPAPAVILPALALSWLAGSFSALVGGMLVMPLGQVTAAFVCGWLLFAWRRESVREPAGPVSRRRQFLVVLAAMAALVVVAWGIFPEARVLPDLESRWLAAQAETTVIHPRFWLVGWIKEVFP